jgi:hypothetical protein
MQGPEKRTFKVRVTSQQGGYVLATCAEPACLSRGRDEATVLAQIQSEIRYRLEWCPCTGVADDYVLLDVERA